MRRRWSAGRSRPPAPSGCRALLGDRASLEDRFPGCPYALPEMGYSFIDRFDAKPWEMDALPWYDAKHLKPWAVRLSLEDGNDFNGLNRLGGRLTVDTSSRFGATGSWNYFSKKLDCGCVEESAVGDLNATYRFAQYEWAQMYAGIGARLRADRCDTQAGFNFLYGADVFPLEPVVVSALFEIGNLDDALVVHARHRGGGAGTDRGVWGLRLLAHRDGELSGAARRREAMVLRS